MTKALLLFLIIIGLSKTDKVLGQAPVDLESIKLITRDSSQAYHYPKLLEEFVTSPEYFPYAKGVHVYYGYLFTKEYKAFNLSKDRVDFNKLLSRRKWSRAAELGEKLLAENPVDMEILSKLSFCYDRNGQQDLAAKLKHRIGVLHRVVMASGDGNRFESPYKVISVSDEYVIMGIERIEGLSRQSKSGNNSIVDIWTARASGKQDQQTVCFEILRNLEGISRPEK